MAESSRAASGLTRVDLHRLHSTPAAETFSPAFLQFFLGLAWLNGRLHGEDLLSPCMKPCQMLPRSIHRSAIDTDKAI
jgi:hypothetical protein